LWRDRLGTEQVQFLLTFEETLIWRNWFDNEQLNGGAWFFASWRLPSGREGVYRFVDAPSYPEFIPPVGWRVTATLEVRGRGMAPQSHQPPEIDGDVAMLLHFDVDEPFVDSSSNHYSVATFGGAFSDDAGALFDGSLTTDGSAGSRCEISGPLLQIPPNVEFTLDIALKFGSFNNGLQVLGNPTTGTSSTYLKQTVDGLSFRYAGGSDQSLGAAAVDTWHRVRICLSMAGTPTLYGFLDGNLVYTDTTTGVAAGTESDAWFIGTKSSNLPLDGQIDELQLKLNVCESTSNYTPSGEPFPNP